MAKQNGNAAAPNVNPATSAQAPDTSGWTKEATGFAPFFKPKTAGDSVVGIVIGHEPGDPSDEDSFSRYLIRALAPAACAKGSEATPVTVPIGEVFTMSEYNQIKPHLDFYLWLFRTKGVEVPFKLTAKEKTPTATKGREVWNWDLSTNPSVAGQIRDGRAEYDRLNAAGQAHALNG